MHPDAGLAAGLAGRDAATPRYRAFISYSHADTAWANWLLKKLEGYRVSRRFHGRVAPVGEVGLRLAPIFRDRDELPTTSDLGETIRGALRESATLIVICSPHSARSRWVGEEIKAFKRLGGERRVFAFIVDGEPKHEGGPDDCFPFALRRELGPDGELSGVAAEVVAADARPHGDGPRLAFVRLVAGLLGVGFDELRQRELQRRNRRLTLIAAGSVLGMAITLGLAVAAWRARSEAVLARNDAQRRQDEAEDVLAFMLGDFRDDLKKVGQLPLLEKVGHKAQGYFETADPRDLTDTALTRQAKALSQIGEVKLLQKDVRFAEAEKAFTAAYQRSSALVARHPRDGDMLFERAQAEFWIGNTALKRGDLPTAATWFGRYRDSAEALVAFDSTRLAWRDELVMARHNLAALELDRGNYDAARAGFLAKLAAVRQLADEEPANLERRYRIADTYSWLGNVATRSGELAEARKNFSAQRSGLEALVSADPKVASWHYKLADCACWEAEALMVTGEISAASERTAQALKQVDGMLKSDPTNRRWQTLRLILILNEAQIIIAGDRAHAEELVREVLISLEKIFAAEPQDRVTAARLITAWRLEARLRAENGRGDPMQAALRSCEIGEMLMRDAQGNYRAGGEYAQACVQAGRVAAAAGKFDEATRFQRKALDALGAKIGGSRDWCLLDPAARALAYLGRPDESADLIARLNRMGYVPIEPWPDGAAAQLSVSNNSPTK